MKQCPSCQRTYDDDALSFCLNDGSHLVPVESSSSNTAPTLIATFPPVNQTTPQQQPRETTPNNWSAPNQSWPNPVYQQPMPVPKKRSALPWLLGLAALLLIGGGALIIVLSSRSSSNSVVSGDSKNTRNGNANTNNSNNVNANNSNNSNSANNSNANRNANSNVNSNANGNTNGNSNANNNSSVAPTNHDAVLADLQRLEDQWNTANMTGDKEMLSYILADDYDGASGNKKKYLASLKPDPNLLSATISNLDLSLDGNRATLRGINTIRFRKGDPARYHFTDSFVWRNGRWQAIGSVAEQIK